MMILNNFLLAFIFSFIGSIPPGTINLTVIQLGIEKRVHLAIRFAFAATFVEYPYAWIAVKFEKLIASSPLITENIHLSASLIMVTLGVIAVWPRGDRPSSLRVKFNNSGYRRGLLVGLLNPLAIPYWIAVTAYMRSHNWINLSQPASLHAYLVGVFCGAFVLMLILAYVSGKAMKAFSDFPFLAKIPGILLILLGIVSWIRYLLNENPGY